MQIVVHIGHPKTGTTSIQRFLARNRLWLARQDALYLDIPHTAPNHNGLLPLFVDPDKIPPHTINRLGTIRPWLPSGRRSAGRRSSTLSGSGLPRR